MRKIIHALLWLKRGLLTDYSKNIKIFSLLEKKIKINKNQNIKLLDIGSHSGSWTMHFVSIIKNLKVYVLGHMNTIMMFEFLINFSLL